LSGRRITPESARFWSRKKKATFEQNHWGQALGTKALPELALNFHVKTISPFAETKIKWSQARQDDALHRNSRLESAERVADRGIRAGLALLIAVSIIGLVTPVSAQTVPIPKPAPKARGGLQMSASDAQKNPLTTGATSAAPPDPVIPDPRRNTPASIFSSFDANQKAQAAKVSSYLSSLQTLVGNFVQVGPDGSKTKGDFYIQKPGKVRFEYDAPSPIDIVADGSSVAVRDRKLATQDIYPLSQTPLRYLLSDRIDLLKDTNVVNVTSDDVFVSVTIEEKQALIGTSRLMLMLGAKDGQLKQWTVTDPQGYDTTVAVYNLDSSKKVDPGLFKIDFTNYALPPG
jgi:outer membrane lipoprotein-sorting protein